MAYDPRMVQVQHEACERAYAECTAERQCRRDTLIERATEVAQSVIGQDPSRDAQEGPGIENTPDLPDFMYLFKQAMISFRFFSLIII
jgi:hypothetical protein